MSFGVGAGGLNCPRQTMDKKAGVGLPRGLQTWPVLYEEEWRIENVVDWVNEVKPISF